MYNKKPFKSGYAGKSSGGRSFGGGGGSKPWERPSFDRREGGKSFGGGHGSHGGHGGYDRPTMFPATCSNCGTSCEVPFKPNGKKPVLCTSCFKAGGAASSFDGPKRFNDRAERPSFDRGSSFERPSHGGGNEAVLKAINVKLDQILAILRDEDTEDEA